MHTIKPIDREAVIAAAMETGAIVTAEEHNIIGGFGAAVAEIIVETRPVPMQRIGTKDCFGRSGNADALLRLYALTPEAIVENARLMISRK